MDDTPWLSTAEQAAWRGFIEMGRLLMAQLERELQQETGLSHTDYQVLVCLSEAPQRMMRMSDLAAQTLLSRSRLSHQVRRMEQAGLVDRTDCLTDRRGSFAVLTDHGWETIQRAAPGHVRSVRSHLFDHLSAEQVTQLEKIAEPVNRHLRDSPPAPDLGDHPVMSTA